MASYPEDMDNNFLQPSEYAPHATATTGESFEPHEFDASHTEMEYSDNNSPTSAPQTSNEISDETVENLKFQGESMEVPDRGIMRHNSDMQTINKQEAGSENSQCVGSNEMVLEPHERKFGEQTNENLNNSSENAQFMGTLGQMTEATSPLTSRVQFRSNDPPIPFGGHTAFAQSHNYATSESLLVHLERQAGEGSLCTVYIDRSEQMPLPNYGGYYDVRNGARYLNATAQTQWEKLKKQKEIMITRENLKPEQKQKNQQTEREAWTQMDRPGAVLENRGDYALYPGPYFTSDDWDMVRIQAAIIIQKYTRGSIARRTARRIRAYAKERKEFWEEQERIRKQEADDHLKYEVQRRMEPRSGDDFEILYTELATWCAQELNKINACGVSGMERRKAVKALLLKEIKLLQTIDKLRCKAARQNKKERISKTLASMCIPHIWELTNGAIVHVKTLGTTRAIDLMHLYHALANPIDKSDERMGVLGYVKWTVQEFSTSLTREILELIEREGDLMNRGRPASSLRGLRLRILNLFLQFIETPEFNPEAIMHQYVPVDFDFGEKSIPTRKRGGT